MQEAIKEEQERGGRPKDTALAAIIRTARTSCRNPWQAYEFAKSAYCSKAGSCDEYDQRIAEVVAALGI